MSTCEPPWAKMEKELLRRLERDSLAILRDSRFMAFVLTLRDYARRGPYRDAARVSLQRVASKAGAAGGVLLPDLRGRKKDREYVPSNQEIRDAFDSTRKQVKEIQARARRMDEVAVVSEVLRLVPGTICDEVRREIEGHVIREGRGGARQTRIKDLARLVRVIVGARYDLAADTVRDRATAARRMWRDAEAQRGRDTPEELEARIAKHYRDRPRDLEALRQRGAARIRKILKHDSPVTRRKSRLQRDLGAPGTQR